MPDNDPMVEPPLDVEDWQIVFQVYEGQATLALTLAYNLISLRSFLESEPNNLAEAIAAIDRAVDSLYEHTEFRHVGLELFRTAVEGKLTTEQEDMLHQLGIRT